MRYHIAKRVAAFIFFGTLAVLVFGFGTMLLWNWLVPSLFGGPVIYFWQAIGLVVLSKILFGGMRFRGRSHWGYKRHWREKWENMSEEERERMREKMQNWCGKRFKVSVETAEEKA